MARLAVQGIDPQPRAGRVRRVRSCCCSPAGFSMSKTDQPAQLYLSFVLDCDEPAGADARAVPQHFSLPNDIKNQTIYTVVTKPVRPGEIVLGRMLGFVLIGTLILAVMGMLSYFFVWRGLSHRHEVEVATLVEDATIVDDKGNRGLSGRTSEDDYHRHTVFIEPDGRGYTDTQKGHRHLVTRIGKGDKARYVVGPPVGQMQARMPQYGSLSFLDRAGKPTSKGINVGNEWTYRSYIEGGTLGAANWTFDNITARRFPASKEFEHGIPVDLDAARLPQLQGRHREGHSRQPGNCRIAHR